MYGCSWRRNNRRLIETGVLVQPAEDVVFQPVIFQEMQDAVISHIREKGSITLAELRDKFRTSRKYAVAVLEYLDDTIKDADQAKRAMAFPC